VDLIALACFWHCQGAAGAGLDIGIRFDLRDNIAMSLDHPLITRTSISRNKKISPGQLLHLYRIQTGLTQSQLAQTIGLKSLRMIQYWEAGNSLPKADNLKRLVESFIRHHAFNEGTEREEIDQLWETVREAELSSRGASYPELDKSWLEKLLVANLLPQSRAASATSLLISPPVPELPGNLPLSPNRFIGRKQELEKVSTLLSEGQTGLLTLVGPGGAGKTRMALEVARHLQLRASEHFPDGVWLVELATISEPQLITQLVATALWSQRQTEGDLLSGLLNYLRNKRLLVILDNREHLIAECATFAGTLLASCPQLKILATSREGLNLSGELVWPVAGLRLSPPNNSGQLKEKDLAESEAVTLFITRAQAVQPTFSLTEANTARSCLTNGLQNA
jgi:transcriptional regulator with XRE-family HTH domain